jgi:hypothetical protein
MYECILFHFKHLSLLSLRTPTARKCTIWTTIICWTVWKHSLFPIRSVHPTGQIQRHPRHQLITSSLKGKFIQVVEIALIQVFEKNVLLLVVMSISCIKLYTSSYHFGLVHNILFKWHCLSNNVVTRFHQLDG